MLPGGTDVKALAGMLPLPLLLLLLLFKLHREEAGVRLGCGLSLGAGGVEVAGLIFAADKV